MKNESILIIGLNWIGDAVMSMPALQIYRLEHPDAEIVLLVKPGLVPLWEMHSAPDRILMQNGSFQTVRRLRRSVYGRAFIFPNSFRSAYLPFAAGVPRRIGPRGHWRRLLLTECIRLGGGHQQFEYMNILGVQGEPPPPRLQVSHDAFRSLERKLHHLTNIGRSMTAVLQALEAERADGSRPVVTLLPGAARGPSKRWPAEHFIALARRLWKELDAVVVLSGGPDDAAACAQIAAAAGDDVLNLAGQTTLKEWAALLKISDCVVANDSGGMHLAAALGTPVAAIYGQTDPKKTGPLGRHIVLQKSDMQNRRIRRNSEAARHALEGVMPDEVFDAVRGLLVL